MSGASSGETGDISNSNSEGESDLIGERGGGSVAFRRVGIGIGTEGTCRSWRNGVWRVGAGALIASMLASQKDQWWTNSMEVR